MRLDTLAHHGWFVANQVLAQMYLYELAWADQDPAQRSITVEVLPKSLDEVARYMVEGFGGTSQLTNKQADHPSVSRPI